MDIWKFYDITHKKHIVLNPMSIDKIEGLFGLLNLKPGPKFLDIACGKREFLIRLVEMFILRELTNLRIIFNISV
jgi:cyclopropane fatty-acyl-phospholipid synthase-like methyltransferase